MSIRENIDKIRTDIEQYSKNPQNVKLIAVTKYVNCDIIKEVLENGVSLLGENKVQILKEKEEKLKILDKNWHFIGNLQKNKVKYIIEFIDTIHSINKISLAKEIDKRAKEKNKIINVLLEINIFEEDSKHGYILQELEKDIEELLKLKNIKIIGLMCMAPHTEDKDKIRDGFKRLRLLKDDLNKKYFNGILTELSMGMSNDYKIALEEGATYIRIGTNLYK